MIKEYLQKFDLDVRKSGDARFMDQKCTPDVVSTIADCVVNFIGNELNKEFTVKDIWDSKYFLNEVKSVFNKPDAKKETSKREYNKFIGQPLRMLAYANVLSVSKRGITNYYTVKNFEVLEYISLKEKYSFNFLYEYFVKVLSDSGLFKYFADYKNKFDANNLSDTDYQFLKEKFEKFLKGNTNIDNDFEANRMFPKILNVYATENNLPGSVDGRLSKQQFYFSDLMYNRKNWRDKKKDKNITRQESDADYDNLISENDNPYNDYLIKKAMNQIRKMYSESEVKDQWSNGDATQIHHIFPKHKFPQLAHYLENLIKLTATQHYTKAHPNNTTKDISIEYQLVCLLAKSDSIEKSIQKNELYYRKESFIYCINSGLSKELNFDLTFRQIKTELVTIYNNI